jgi:hypothetical protein
VKRAPLLVLRPAKPIAAMTDVQRRAFARRLSTLLADIAENVRKEAPPSDGRGD